MSGSPNRQGQFSADPVLTLRIIVAALLVGPLGMLVVVFATADTTRLLKPQPGVLTGLAALLSIGSAVAAWVVPRMIDRSAEQTLRLSLDDPSFEAQLMARLQVRTLVGCALLEGAAFFNLVICLADTNLWPLLTTIGLLALMVLFFPTGNRVQRWLAQRREGITQRKSFS